MTIIVEREALLRVINREPLYNPSHCEDTIRSDNGEFVVVELPKPFLGEDFYDRSLRVTTCDEDQSICTLSTDSLSSQSSQSVERRVSFASSLVTDEWTRPWTPKEEVSNLFYSTEETLRFRQEYRFERKVLSDLSIDVDNHCLDSEELSNLVSTTAKCQSPSRHQISRVVVMHNDKLETFVNPSALSESKESVSGDFFDNDSFWSGSLTWY